MYRKPHFLEMLHAIREEMSREADYDVELFAEMARTGTRPAHGAARNIRGFRTRAPRADEKHDTKIKSIASIKHRRGATR
ncbi:MAG: hypothetical protein LC746_03355 [Acidobacteria bacterium]|nr:hypothetical protein [Acidobacteriota bacterium]